VNRQQLEHVIEEVGRRTGLEQVEADSNLRQRINDRIEAAFR